MKTKNNKQRLFEVMSRLDKTFKPILNENIDNKVSDVRNDNNHVNEISSDLFKSAINVSKDRGTHGRTYKLGSTYFNKFIGKPLFDGVIKNIGIDNSRGHNLVTIEVNYPNDNPQTAIIKKNRGDNIFHYYIDGDEYNINNEISRKDAFLLSRIALHVNPDSKYKEVARFFKIKGYQE